MALVFNDTTNKQGIIQGIERAIGFNDGEISGDSELLEQFTAEINLSKGNLFQHILNIGGRWQPGDTNNTQYSEVTTNIVSGQQDYFFTEDTQGNIILDVYKVLVKDTNGDYYEVPNVDRQGEQDMAAFSNQRPGTPIRHDKTDNGIFLDPVPDYDATDGLQLLVSKESLRFSSSDTDVKTGFDPRVDEVLILEPAYRYARTHLSAGQTNRLKEDLFMYTQPKGIIYQVYGKREKSQPRRMIPMRQYNQ